MNVLGLRSQSTLRSIGALLAALACLAAPERALAGDSDALVAAYVAAWNGGPDGFETVLAADFSDRTALLPLDRSQFVAQAAAWRQAIPDLRVTLVERASAAGSEVLRLRFEGRPSDPSGLTPFSGGGISLEQTEWLAVSARHLVSRRAAVDDWTLPTELMFQPPATLPSMSYQAATIANLGVGRFLESIAIAADGRLLVSTGLDGAIVTVDAQGRVAPFAQVDVGPGGFMMCLAVDASGSVYASVNSRRPEVLGIWRFDRHGQGERLAALPAGATPNGLAFDGRGHLLVADSFAGLIWRVPLAGGEPVVWLRHPWLAPRPLVGRFPGANGLQRAGDAIIVAVSDRSLLLRVPLLQDGAPGEPVVLVSGLPADDFAVATDGTLYVTTHPFNSVVRVTPDGQRTTIAGPAQGIVGPTAAALGADGQLYVVSDGGLFRPLPGVAPLSTVVRLQPVHPQIRGPADAVHGP